MKTPDVILSGTAILVTLLLLISVVYPQEHQHEAPREPSAVKLDTDLVSLSVTVTDRNGQAALGLKREDFKVYENGIEQPISFFSAEEAPACWGLILDRSGSMYEMIQDVYRAALHVMDEGTDQDEMFILTFNDGTEIVSDLTSDRHKWENSILGLRAGGMTALYDAVARALDHIKRAKHQKKVLVVITDGEDNRSRLGFRQLAELVEERGVLVYTVGMFESMERPGFGPAGGSGRGELEKLAEITGASSHFPTNVQQCKETMRTIALEVSRQYSVGYYPSNTKRDGQWRKIKVTIGGSDRESKFMARTRRGYYARTGEDLK